MTAKEAEAALTNEILGVLRRDFYAGKDARTFFRERPWLLRAITYPAAYLHKRGALLPASRYRRILTTVIDTIKAKGNRAKIERFSVYFLHCVQTHMTHHGEEYYYAGKSFEGRSISPRHVSDLVGGAVKKMAAGAAVDNTVPILAAAHAALTFRGRIQKRKSADSELDLFAGCNRRAKAGKPPGKGANLCHFPQNPADSSQSSPG